MISKVILSGQRNCGKTTLLWRLQKRMNWPVFSVSQYLRDYVVTNHLQRSSQATLEAHHAAMYQEINDRVEALLTSEHSVLIEARFFAGITKKWPNTLKVLLQADDQTRIARHAAREKTTPERAAHKLLTKEAAWLADVSRQSGVEVPYDPEHYDLVINTGIIGPQEAEAMVVSWISLLK